MELSPSTGQAVLAIAARALINRLQGVTPFSPVFPDDPALLAPAGCFVSLHRSGTHQLRGCIGIVENPRPFRDILVGTAESALRDPRFITQPITLAEVEQLEVEVTVMGPLQLAPSVMHFEPGVHGIVLVVGGKSGLFLPQVARETGWNREQLLDRLSYEKLGVAPKAWRHPTAVLRTFTSQIIGPQNVLQAAQSISI